MATSIIKNLICGGVFLAVIPAISFANQQGLAALNNKGAEEHIIVHCTDTIPASTANTKPLQEPQKATVFKKVPKSRRQAKPLPLPSPAIKPVIKPKIVRPLVKVAP
jgi:hypothetical protein